MRASQRLVQAQVRPQCHVRDKPELPRIQREGFHSGALGHNKVHVMEFAKKKVAPVDVDIWWKRFPAQVHINTSHLLETELGHVFPRGGEVESRDRSQRSQHLLLLGGGQLKNLIVLCFKSEHNQQSNLSLSLETTNDKKTNFGKSATESNTYHDRWNRDSIVW